MRLGTHARDSLTEQEERPFIRSCFQHRTAVFAPPTSVTARSINQSSRAIYRHQFEIQNCV